MQQRISELEQQQQQQQQQQCRHDNTPPAPAGLTAADGTANTSPAHTGRALAHRSA